MPYFEDEDVPKYVPEDKKAQWREVWNSVYTRALARGETREEAEASAFAKLTGSSKRAFGSIGADTDNQSDCHHHYVLASLLRLLGNLGHRYLTGGNQGNL